MDRMGLEEGEVIQHSMMTIYRTRRKKSRKTTLVFVNVCWNNDVMNAQRSNIYKRRRHALFGERLKLDIANMLYDTCELIIQDNKRANDFKTLNLT
jgi:preprotein translocase subunit SecA